MGLFCAYWERRQQDTSGTRHAFAHSLNSELFRSRARARNLLFFAADELLSTLILGKANS